MTSQYDFTTLKNYDKTQFEIEGKKLIKFIGDYTKVKIPEGVTEIGENAFEGKDFDDLFVPTSVTKMAPTAFCGCDKIRSVEMPFCLADTTDKLKELFGENVKFIKFNFVLGSSEEIARIKTFLDELKKIQVHMDEDKAKNLEIDFGREEPVLRQVLRHLATTDEVSASLLQRQFAIGYERASRILDFLRDRDIICPESESSDGVCSLNTLKVRQDALKKALKAAEASDVPDEFSKSTTENPTPIEPPSTLIKDALRLIITKDEANFTMLQRNLQIGYAKAIRILEILEKFGFIQLEENSRYKVNITKQEFELLLGETL